MSAILEKVKMPPLNLKESLDDEMVEVTDIELTLVSGFKVSKVQLREKLGVKTRWAFRDDITAACKGNQEFETLWLQWKTSPYLSAELAVFICRHLFPERKVKLA